jgi:hypothetical protein
MIDALSGLQMYLKRIAFSTARSWLTKETLAGKG